MGVNQTIVDLRRLGAFAFFSRPNWLGDPRRHYRLSTCHLNGAISQKCSLLTLLLWVRKIKRQLRTFIIKLYLKKIGADKRPYCWLAWWTGWTPSMAGHGLSKCRLRYDYYEVSFREFRPIEVKGFLSLSTLMAKWLHPTLLQPLHEIHHNAFGNVTTSMRVAQFPRVAPKP